jgi:hypothetical protein
MDGYNKKEEKKYEIPVFTHDASIDRLVPVATELRYGYRLAFLRTDVLCIG